MGFERSRLRSLVARRILMLFVVCTIIPMTALALLTHHAVRDQLEEQHWQRLHRDAKSMAMSIVERLALVDAELDVAARLIAGPQAGAVSSAAIPKGLLRSTSFVAWHEDGSSEDVVLSGGLSSQALPRGLGGLGAGDSDARRVVTIKGRPGETALTFVLRRVDAGGTHGTLVAEVDTVRLLDLSDDSLRPPLTEACVLDDTRSILGCSSGISGPDTARMATGPGAAAAGRFTVTGDETLDASYWAAPLKATYGVSNWTVVLATRRADALAPTRAFREMFVAVLAVSLLTVLLLSLWVIRHSLGPLERLKDAANRVAAQDFRTPVRIESRDEFQEVGAAFNTMVRALEGKFSELKALHMGTLRALARAIDAKSHWTAGHSNRVTELAVEIGRELGLEDEVLRDLEVGGLLHDIGKLGVPGQILDKPGPLTDEEIGTMRQHPVLGVQILEPIPSMRSVLPIVLQHHERYDGQGYPAGLAGDDISLAARIFAVADVFDALHSERPYRKSMPEELASAHIASQSGLHFDPGVVEAFLRVMERRDTGRFDPARIARAS